MASNTKNNEYNLGYIIFLSVAAAIGGFLFGYDTAVVSGTNEAVWKYFDIEGSSFSGGFFVSAAIIGSILGAICGGTVSERIGRKRSMFFAALLFLVSSVACAMCGSFAELIIARISGGFGIGLASVVCPCYISELAAARYRGSLVALYQFAITFGILAAYGVNYLLNAHAAEAILTVGQNPSTWDTVWVTEIWRGMLGMCALPAVVFIVVLLFVPESPRWLVVRGRINVAEHILSNIYRAKDAVAAQIRQINGTNAGSSGQWSYIRKHPRIIKAILIGMAIAMLGQFMGVNAVIYYGPTIFTNAGFEGDAAMMSQVWVGVVNCVTTVIAMFIIDKVGRKGLVYFGVTGMILFLIAISGYYHFHEAWGLSGSLMVFFLVGYIFCQAISISAIIFVILSEMYPNKVRGLAMSIASMALWIANWLVSQLFPWMLDNLSPSFTFLIFAGCCIPYILIIRFLVPDTTGKTLEQIEAHWLRN